MTKRIRKILISAVLFIVLGLMCFMFGMAKNNWSLKKLISRDFETNSYEIFDDFDTISIKADTTDIDFQYSNDDKCRIVCYEHKKEKHQAAVEDGVLNINNVNEKKWYDYIDLFSDQPQITVYLPNTENVHLLIELSTGDININKDLVFESISIKGSTGDVRCAASSIGKTKIHLSTGDISIENATAESYDLLTSSGDIGLTGVNCDGVLRFDVSTGDCRLINVNCGSISSFGSTGDISLTNVIATEAISITRDTGDVEFDRCDAAELVIMTDTGDVEGTLLSDKIFIVRTDTGEINVPPTVSGGKCEITTDTGDIEFRIVNL